MKEGIHIQNYEAWLLDRLEGRLSVEEEKQVESFLHAHPECRSQLEGEELWTLELDSVPYDHKERLYKNLPDAHTELGEHNFDLFSIARMEGDLIPSQEEEHERMLRGNDHLAQRWQDWQRTRLHAGKVAYADKQGLYRRESFFRRQVWWSLGAAAAVAAVVFILLRSSPDMAPPIAMEQENLPRMQEQEQEAAVPDEAVPEAEKIYREPQAAALRIQKYQDPPELTGEKTALTAYTIAADSASRMVREEEIRPRALRLAALDIYPGHTADPGQADEIHSLDLPVFAAQNPPKRLRDASRDFFRERDISVLTLAHAGIQGINRLTGSELSMDLARTEDGDVSGFSFQGQRMSVEAPVGKAE